MISTDSPEWLAVSNRSTSYIGKQATSETESFAGDIQFNFNTQTMEVYNGSYWQEIAGPNTYVSMSPSAHAALDWAYTKMRDEKALKERMEKHPGLKDAYEKFQMMDALTQQEEDVRESNTTSI